MNHETVSPGIALPHGWEVSAPRAAEQYEIDAAVAGLLNPLGVDVVHVAVGIVLAHVVTFLTSAHHVGPVWFWWLFSKRSEQIEITLGRTKLMLWDPEGGTILGVW